METSLAEDTQPFFILVRPQLPENIGAVIRALGNTGLWRNLRLVEPMFPWPHPKSEAVASGVPTACVNLSASLSEAISDLDAVIASTQRRRGMVYEAATLQEALKKAHDTLTNGHRVGFVFGPEKTGLTSEEISLCHSTLHLNAHPDFPCYNLSQAVLVVAYNWFNQYGLSARLPPPSSVSGPTSPLLASHGAVKGFFDHFEALSQRLALPISERPGMLRHLRHLFLRRPLYHHEVKSLRGILKSFEKKLERKE